MSRSGYSDDLEQSELAMWRGRVASAIRGKRGQKLLRDLFAALIAMPTKELIAEELVTKDGEVCALGCLAQAQGKDMCDIDPEDYDAVAEQFNISPCLAQEIVFENDENSPYHSDKRWKHMHDWVKSKINWKNNEI